MGVRPFHEVLASEGLDLGLEPNLLDFIRDQTSQGKSLAELYRNKLILKASLGPRHLLQIRLSAWRYKQMASAAQDLPSDFTIRNVLELQALRWALRAGKTYSTPLPNLFSCAVVLAASTLKKGRIRMHLVQPEDHQSEEFFDLAEHTESLDKIPPHRWFKASRAVAARLLWLEVIPPDKEAERIVGAGADKNFLSDLQRSIVKPVLDSVADMAQTKIVTAAAQALLSMLSNPIIKGSVAGVILDAKHAYGAIVDDDYKCKRRRFDAWKLDQLVAWLAAHDIQHVALARLKGMRSLRDLMSLLQGKAICSEPANMAGVMKQAGSLPGPVREAAAEILACRYKNPVRGTQGLEPYELGLGEYLDRVDQGFLKFALSDARDAAIIQLQHAGGSVGLKTVGNLNPMVHTLQDLRRGMEVSGVVQNLTHFGAFVDMGLEQQGLIHISELSDSRIEHPSEVVRVGQQVKVKILQVDIQRGRISLSMRSKKHESRYEEGKSRTNALKALDHLFNK